LFLVLTDAYPGARATILAEPESHDLIRQLADRSDWDRLWQLVRELPRPHTAGQHGQRSGGRVAIAGARADGVGGWAVYDAHTGDLIASAESAGRPTGIRFDGPSRLIVTSVLRDAGYVRVWYLDGAQAEFLASASVYGARNPVVIPGRDQICVLATRGSRVRVFEGVTLRKARAPKGFPGQAVRRQWNSADDRIWVLAGAKFATVFPGRHSVLTVADRPPTGWGPADQGIVAEALGSPGVDAAARPLLDLLQARLACRAVLPVETPWFELRHSVVMGRPARERGRGPSARRERTGAGPEPAGA
jgi:hypothetical protein